MRMASIRGATFGIALLACAAATANAPGDRVLARWAPDGYWYPARLTDLSGSEATVKYDDGKVAIMDAADVRAIEWHAGTRLQCDWKGQGNYYWGKVAAMEGESITFDYDDGYKESLTVSRCRSKPAEK
jgi:hypothetical protein